MELPTLSNFEALWLTLYGEARGEPIEGQIAVANVIRNRTLESGKSYVDVCLAPMQFSCWNQNDPNRIILEELITKEVIAGEQYDDRTVSGLKVIAQQIIGGGLADNTKDSNHYLTTSLYRSDKCPKWAKEGKFNVVIGGHTFLWAA